MPFKGGRVSLTCSRHQPPPKPHSPPDLCKIRGLSSRVIQLGRNGLKAGPGVGEEGQRVDGVGGKGIGDILQVYRLRWFC